MYEGMSDLYRSYRVDKVRLSVHACSRIVGVLGRTCPAVSHNCNLTVRSSKYMALLRKSIPIVAWYVLSKVSYINLSTV